MAIGFDCTDTITSNLAGQFLSQGYQCVARYLGDKNNSWKCFDANEAKTILDSGLNLVSIYETNPTHDYYFTRGQGIEDAQNATQYANASGQPKGSAIYFTVDYDAQDGDIQGILDYVQGVKDTLKDYKVGIYGSYRVILAVKDKVDYYWQTLAWSRGQIADFLNMYQKDNDVSVNGCSIDNNIIYKEIGAWNESQQQSTPQQSNNNIQLDNSYQKVIVAIDDVWLHSTPDTNQGSRIKVLPKYSKWQVFGDKSGMYCFGGNQFASIQYFQDQTQQSQPQASNEIQLDNKYEKTVIATADVWLHTTPDANTDSRIKILPKDSTWKVFGDKNGMYCFGGNQFASMNFLSEQQSTDNSGVQLDNRYQKTVTANTDVWLHNAPDTDQGSRVKILPSGSEWQVFGDKNGMYCFGGQQYSSMNYFN